MVRDLYAFATERRGIAPNVPTFAAVFRGPTPTGEVDFERALWRAGVTRGNKAPGRAIRHRDLRCDDQVDALLKIAGVSDLVDASATANDADESKPAPNILHAAVLAARSRAENSVMLGDTRYDIQAAHAAGLPAIALRCGGAAEADLAGSAAMFETPRDFAKALETRSLREIVTAV